MDGRNHRRVDDRVPIPFCQLGKTTRAGTVSVQGLGTPPGLATYPPCKGRDVESPPDCLVHDGTPQKTGASKHKKPHAVHSAETLGIRGNAYAESGLHYAVGTPVIC